MPNSNGPQSRKIAVVGAGIAGVSNALYLQRDGHNVTLLDPEPPGSMASFGNSGLIAAYSCMPTATPDMLARVPKLLMDPTGPLSIRWTYLPQLLPWLASLIRNSAPERILANATVKARLLDLSWEAYRTLIEDADAGDLVAQGGMLRVYRTEAAFAASKGRELKTMRATGRKLEILGADEIRQLEPGLEPIFTNAYFFPDTYGILNPGRLTEVFARYFTDRGRKLLREGVTNLVRDGSGGWRVTTDKGEHVVDLVVIAAGAWSRRLARMFGVKLLLDSERGYHVMMPAPEPGLRRPVHFFENVAMISPMEDGYRLTTGVELAGIDAAPDYRRIRVTVKKAEELVKGLRADEQSIWMGRRPSTPDTVPILGPARDAAGIYFATGGAHIGMTLGPVMGRINADLIAGRDPGIDLTPYNAERW